MQNYICPIHGPVPEEQQLLSSGGLYCTVADSDQACCMKPLEEREQNADNSK